MLGTADLSIDKTGTVNPIQGGADTYTLTIANAEPDTAHGVVVFDSLPSQFTATSATGGAFACTLPGGAGRNRGLHLWPRLLPPEARRCRSRSPARWRRAQGQSIADAATVSSNTADPDSDQQHGDVQPARRSRRPTWRIAKAAFLNVGVTPVTNPLQVGNTFIYRLTVTNNGPSAATAVTVTDPLPTGITPVTPLPARCAARRP